MESLPADVANCALFLTGQASNPLAAEEARKALVASLEEKRAAEEAHGLLEEQYRESQKMDAIGQLAGGVAHDFNNLLTVITGYCDLLRDDLGPGSHHQTDLAEIQRAAERAASLTRQLLAFSRRQILEPRVLSLSDSLRAMEPMLRRLIGEHIDVVVRTPPEIGELEHRAWSLRQVSGTCEGSYPRRQHQQAAELIPTAIRP